jgi:hypothetical protein
MSSLPPLTTPLAKALTWRLMMELTQWAIGRMKDPTHGEECAGKTFELLAKRERERWCWNPKGPWTIRKYAFRTCRGVMATFRRWFEKNEEDAIAEMDEICPGLNDVADEADIERQRADESIAEQVYRDLAAHPKGTLPIAMLKAAEEGFEGDHQELAARCNVTVPEIRSAQALLTRICNGRKEKWHEEQRRDAVAEASRGHEAMKRDREGA